MPLVKFQIPDTYPCALSYCSTGGETYKTSKKNGIVGHLLVAQEVFVFPPYEIFNKWGRFFSRIPNRETSIKIISSRFPNQIGEKLAHKLRNLNPYKKGSPYKFLGSSTVWPLYNQWGCNRSQYPFWVAFSAGWTERHGHIPLVGIHRAPTTRHRMVEEIAKNREHTVL